MWFIENTGKKKHFHILLHVLGVKFYFHANSVSKILICGLFLEIEHLYHYIRSVRFYSILNLIRS